MSDEEMSDTEMWRAHAEASKAKRADNRDRSTEILVIAGVPFVSKNDGAHLIVAERFDFWPGTGLWMERGKAKKHRGIRSLLQRVMP
jgi:hypothetical protein